MSDFKIICYIVISVILICSVFTMNMMIKDILEKGENVSIGHFLALIPIAVILSPIGPLITITKKVEPYFNKPLFVSKNKPIRNTNKEQIVPHTTKVVKECLGEILIKKHKNSDVNIETVNGNVYIGKESDGL